MPYKVDYSPSKVGYSPYTHGECHQLLGHIQGFDDGHAHGD